MRQTRTKNEMPSVVLCNGANFVADNGCAYGGKKWLLSSAGTRTPPPRPVLNEHPYGARIVKSGLFCLLLARRRNETPPPHPRRQHQPPSGCGFSWTMPEVQDR